MELLQTTNLVRICLIYAEKNMEFLHVTSPIHLS